MTEQPIVSVVRVAGVPAFKCTLNTGRPGWGVNVVYTFADGTSTQSTVTSRTRRDLDQCVASEHGAAVEGNLKASFDDAGKFYSTVRLFRIGGSR